MDVRICNRSSKLALTFVSFLDDQRLTPVSVSRMHHLLVDNADPAAIMGSSTFPSFRKCVSAGKNDRSRCTGLPAILHLNSCPAWYHVDSPDPRHGSAGLELDAAGDEASGTGHSIIPSPPV